jgi:hypothetical protein
LIQIVCRYLSYRLLSIIIVCRCFFIISYSLIHNYHF